MQIQEKLDHIYNDLSHNKTRIHGRQNLHLAIDLTFHSPLQIMFEGALRKGYPECLIIGDTKCGKTETAIKLIEHYQLGAFSPAENTSFAGLVGSCQQVRNRWQIIWGKIPFNNRRLLVLDEVSGLSHDDIGNMSSIRSSGIAEITKAKSAKVESKTRLIWIANSKGGHNVDHYDSGISLVKELIGKQEDISRFDYILIISANDVDEDLINDPDLSEVPHVYTSDYCRDLIMWAWTRSPAQIIMSADTLKACREYAKLMYTKYSKDFPLVNAGEQKLKLARLATALACRLFSTKTGKEVIVKPEHVAYIHWFLNNEYDKPSFDYDNWSKKHKQINSVTDRKKVWDILVEMEPSVATFILRTRQLSVKGIADAMGLGDAEARLIVSSLIKANALNHSHTQYYKTPGFIRIIKEYLNSPEIQESEF